MSDMIPSERLLFCCSDLFGLFPTAYCQKTRIRRSPLACEMITEGIPDSLWSHELETIAGLYHWFGRPRITAEKRISGDREPSPPQADQGANTAHRPGA